MALWALTKAELVNGIETLLRRLTGQETVTYQEKKTIENAFNAAIVDICLDRGVSRWRFIQTDKTATTTASTAYVDLDANIYNVVSGTVRIEAENITLNPMTLEYMYSSDPDRDYEDTPMNYALDASSDAETMRMYFLPIPNAALTVSFVAEVLPDEDSISSFPSWTHHCLKDKATANALRDLGLGDHAIPFERSYERRKQDAKVSQGHDGPVHIRKHRGIQHRDLQSRLPD